MKHRINNSNMSFAEVCGFLAAADHILVDGKRFELREYNASNAMILVGSDPDSGPPDSITTWFTEEDNGRISLTNGTLRMKEEHGEFAEVRPVWSGVDVFKTAETAAAFMDAIHSEVCRQSEGSDGAYEELYEAATRMGGGFTLIWSWVATMAVAARERMEGLWESGEAEFIECVQVAAQEFHNYITDPRTLPDAATDIELTEEKAAQLWEVALVALAVHHAEASKWQEEAEMRAMIEELTVATRNGAGHSIGCFPRVSEITIEYTNYGGPTMTIRRRGNGMWRVGDDDGTDSPRPVGAFKIASIPIVRA